MCELRFARCVLLINQGMLARNSASRVLRVARRAMSSSASDRVAVTRGADGVVSVALTRPEKLNALDMNMFRDIQSAARDLIADSDSVGQRIRLSILEIAIFGSSVLNIAAPPGPKK